MLLPYGLCTATIAQLCPLTVAMNVHGPSLVYHCRMSGGLAFKCFHGRCVSPACIAMYYDVSLLPSSELLC